MIMFQNGIKNEVCLKVDRNIEEDIEIRKEYGVKEGGKYNRIQRVQKQRLQWIKIQINDLEDKF